MASSIESAPALGGVAGDTAGAGDNPAGGPWNGGREPWQKEAAREDLPLSNLFVTMLQRLGVETDKFAGSTGTLDEV